LSRAGQGDLAADRAAALTLTPVSCETIARLDAFVDLLLAWQKTTNLISPSTIPHVWTRHVTDSLQLVDLLPGARTWVDLGSGGGFAGIPVACVLAERLGAAVHLVESNGKKAAFLREAVRITGVPAVVHQARIEDCGDSFGDKIDAVSARALAPLKILCGLAFPFIRTGAIGLFLKGQDVAAELTDAAKCWRIKAETVPSRTSSEGCIVVVRGLERL
jgi:16S rRNA (guanine527-N7)-methyltransferase